MKQTKPNKLNKLFVTAFGFLLMAMLVYGASVITNTKITTDIFEGNISCKNVTGATSDLCTIPSIFTESSSIYYSGTKYLGIGTSTVLAQLHIHEASNGFSYMAFTNDDTGLSSGDGITMGLDYQESFHLSLGDNTQNLSIKSNTLNEDTKKLISMSHKGNIFFDGNVSIYETLNLKKDLIITQNVTLGISSLPRNITLYSPNGNQFSCGVNDAGTFECVANN